MKPVDYQLEANEKKALKKGKKIFSKVAKFIKENDTFLPVDIGGDCDQLHGEIAQVKKQVEKDLLPPVYAQGISSLLKGEVGILRSVDKATGKRRRKKPRKRQGGKSKTKSSAEKASQEKKKRRRRSKKGKEVILINEEGHAACGTCRGQLQHHNWIQCDGCDRWFHTICKNVVVPTKRLI